MGTDGEKNMAEDGVSERITAQENAGRAPNGHFLPGHSIKSPGRPSKAKEQAALAAVMDAVTPEKIAETIDGLLNHATSWRARQAGLELHLAYTLGKPVQRIQQSEGGLAAVLEELGDE